MRTVQVPELVDRVLSTDTVVPFTGSDPNGHLATGRYVDAIVDHRLEAFERQLGINWYEIARDLHVAYVIGELNVRFLRPMRAGGRLTVASWISGFRTKSVSARALFIAADGLVSATARFEAIAVDTRSGRAVEHPEIPARDDGAIAALPRAADLLAMLGNVPE